MSSTGGTIDVSIIKPAIISTNFLTCSSTSLSVLFNVQLEITSGIVSTPTSNPLELPSNFIGIKGAPFYAISLTVVLFLMYGVVLVRLRDVSEGAVPLKLSKVCLHLGLSGANIASELAYINTLLTFSELKVFAVVILLARLFHIPGGCYILNKLMTSGDQSNHYLQLIDKDDLLKNRSTYSLLFLVSFLDNANIAYLPWLGNKVSISSFFLLLLL